MRVRGISINGTVGRMMNRVKECIKECEPCTMTLMRAEHWATVFNSYFGFLIQTNSWKIRKEIMAMLTHDFYRYFYVVNSRKVKVKNRYKNESIRLCS